MTGSQSMIDLAVELEDDAQHAVRARVLRTHVQGHQALAGLAARRSSLDRSACRSTARPR